jgi:hypothetical protein
MIGGGRNTNKYIFLVRFLTPDPVFKDGSVIIGTDFQGFLVGLARYSRNKGVSTPLALPELLEARTYISPSSPRPVCP